MISRLLVLLTSSATISLPAHSLSLTQSLLLMMSTVQSMGSDHSRTSVPTKTECSNCSMREGLKTTQDALSISQWTPTLPSFCSPGVWVTRSRYRICIWQLGLASSRYSFSQGHLKAVYEET